MSEPHKLILSRVGFYMKRDSESVTLTVGELRTLMNYPSPRGTPDFYSLAQVERWAEDNCKDLECERTPRSALSFTTMGAC